MNIETLFVLAIICKIALALLSVCTVCIVSDSVIQVVYFIWNRKDRKNQVSTDFDVKNLEDDGK